MTGLNSSQFSLEPILDRGQLNCSIASQLEGLDSQLEAVTTMSARATAEAGLRSLDTRVRDMLYDLDPNLITEHAAPSMKDELCEVGEARDSYRDSVRKFLSDFAGELTTPEVTQWNADLKSLVDLVKANKFAILAKVNQLMPPAVPMTEFEKASIDLQQKQFALQQQAETNKKDEALAIARPLKKLVLDRCAELDDDLDQIPVSQLVTGDEQQVTRTMQKLAGWKLQAESISSLYQEFLTKTALFQLPSGEQSQVSAAVLRTKSALADIITAAEQEDLKRQLYSLDTSNRGEQVKWPGFSGEAGEDFFKFKRDFLDAAKQNRISTKNQITKLRENIRGYAKSLIPDSITEITRGFEILEHACGDTMKVVTNRVENLMKVGPWPQEGSKDCYTKQVRWIVKVQTLLQEIIDLADTDEALADVIYNKEKLAQILRLFPTFMVDKLAKIQGYKQEKYNKIIVKLDEMKAISQNRELVYGPSQTSQTQQKSPPITEHQLPIPTGHINFQQPKKLSSCRICQVLQSQGDTSGLFEKHVSDYATGCPKFASLGTDERMVIAREAKLCVNCMGKTLSSARHTTWSAPSRQGRASTLARRIPACCTCGCVASMRMITKNKWKSLMSNSSQSQAHNLCL